MNPGSPPFVEAVAPSGSPDLSQLFHLHYPKIARVIARIVNDPGRAEEIAADVFWKFMHSPNLQHSNPSGWLYRTGVRKAIDELRRQQRREKYERLLSFLGSPKTPEQLHHAAEDQKQVRSVLAALKHRDSEILVLRSEGLSYEETAEILGLNETSMGTLVRRAQEAFRKEYVKRYGQPKF